MNIFIPQSNFPLTSHINFPHQQSIRGGYRQPYFNFNEFNTKRNSLIEKFKELTNESTDVVNKHSTSIQNVDNLKAGQKINVSFYF